MAEMSVGLRIQGHFSRLYVLAILFGLTLSNQLEKAEILELVEDFQDSTGVHLLEKHEIVRRAAVQPNVSMALPSALPSRLNSKPYHDVTLSSYSSLKQSLSPITRSHVGSIKPSTTASPVVKTMSVFTPLPTKAVATSKKPDTQTTEKKSTSKRTTPTRRATTAFPSQTGYDEDHHKYYKSQYYVHGKQWWFNLDDGIHGSKKTMFHHDLSKNIKFSDLFKTSFIFPYYGHLVENVTITNKGYVFLGERLHRFNASAQYVAPLMADFGADLHNRTSIRYIDTGDRLTVEWTNMKVRKEAKGKEFSFQCSIFKNGTFIFAYRKIPIPVEKIRKADFFVRVGLSDTYRTERVVRGHHVINGKSYSAVRYITYHLYDRVRLLKTKVVEGSAFVLIPLPNCVMFNSCDTCLNTPTKFDCLWCPKIKRCSDGIDRHRMEWETAGCMKDAVKSCSDDSSGISGGEIAVIVLVLLVVIFAVSWCVYAYTHPQSKSGLFLIKYGNPTKWFRNSSGTQSSSTDGRISFKTMPFENNA